jgi:hypothetical protein
MPGGPMLTFIIGLALAIPLSIAANIFTPRAQEWLSKRSSKRLVSRTRSLVRDYETTKSYVENPVKFQAFVSSRVVTLCGRIFFLAVFLVTFTLIQSYGGSSSGWGLEGKIASYITSALMILLVILTNLINRDMQKTIERVRNFEEYTQYYEKQLRKLGTD